MIDVFPADYSDPEHGAALLDLLDAYALDPMGGGKALSAYTHEHLVRSLAERDDAVTVFARVGGKYVGLVNCFEGFSTFACRPLLNIHDVVVLAQFRGRGVSVRMLEEVERIAGERGCCKLTLEVLDGNEIAKAAYLRLGFARYELDPKLGGAVFWEKKL